MEEIEKCIAIAISEFSRLNFNGLATIPAGRVMDALHVAQNEIKKLKQEENDG